MDETARQSIANARSGEIQIVTRVTWLRGYAPAKAARVHKHAKATEAFPLACFCEAKPSRATGCVSGGDDPKTRGLRWPGSYVARAGNGCGRRSWSS